MDRLYKKNDWTTDGWGYGTNPKVNKRWGLLDSPLGMIPFLLYLFNLEIFLICQCGNAKQWGNGTQKEESISMRIYQLISKMTSIALHSKFSLCAWAEGLIYKLHRVVVIDITREGGVGASPFTSFSPWRCVGLEEPT